MNSRSAYSRLCGLIDESLRPYTYLQEWFVVSLTKGNEKDLLSALSLVLRQIQLWIHQFDYDYDNVAAVKPACNSKCAGGSEPHSEDHRCLTRIIGDLIFLLAIENQYVQHVAGNVLVVVSEFVVASGSEWDEFMHLLCLCLELAICHALSSSSEPPTVKAKDLDCDSSSSIIALKLRLKNANWSSVAGIIRVLRNILKHLKQEFDDNLFEVYLDSISSCLSNVPWDLLNEIHVGQDGKSLRSSSRDALLHTKVGQPESRIMFYGNLVQFLCSLVEQCGLVESASGSFDKHPIICEISNLVPNLLAWCLGEERDCCNKCISQYFRHKILSLMIRLSFQMHLEHSVVVSWLHLIHKYFQDLLSQPITQPESDQDDCLEGSPFLVSVCGVEKRSLSSRHLERLAIFLFLRCSFSLISLRDRTDEQSICTNLNSCSTFGLNLDLECCSRKRGLLELYEWLQGQLPADIFVDHELYFESCTSFASSFLRLYMHEDDILFKVLLQLFCMPFCSMQRVCKERTPQEVKDDMLFRISDLFNPIYFFHLFLAELLYDHQVLLDYLISKDTGASSAEYLLRCLRMVCDSWNLFVEFSAVGKGINQSSRKKRKVLLGGLESLGELSSASLEGDAIPPSLKKVNNRDHTYGGEHCRADRQPFEDARECLLSLKKSVQSLHQKNLFPYNPEVLLRRLTRFQELCFKQQKIFSENGGIM